MPTAVLALTLLAATAPAQRATFLWAQDGVLAGQATVSLTDDRRRLVLRLEHVFGRGGTGHVVEEHAVDLDGPGTVAGSSRVPVSLWLWRQPGAGCTDVEDERTRRRGQGCVERLTEESAEGTVLDQEFRASYRGGLLSALDVGRLRWVRAARPVAHDVPAPAWDRGFAVAPGAGRLALAPAVPLPPGPDEPSPRTRGWALKLLHDFGVVPDGERSSDTARRFVKWTSRQAVRSELVLGVTVAGARAWPHVWTRLSAANGERVDVDPSFGRIASAGTVLALALATPESPGMEAGQLYLDLISGGRRVVRRR